MQRHQSVVSGSKSTPPDPILRPIHRADVKLGIGREARDAFTRQTQPCVEIDDRLEPEVDRGLIGASTMTVEVRCNAFKSAPSNTVEPSQSPWVRGPMIGTLPSCHWPWTNVQVCEWLTDLLLGTMTTLHVGDCA